MTNFFYSLNENSASRPSLEKDIPHEQGESLFPGLFPPNTPDLQGTLSRREVSVISPQLLQDPASSSLEFDLDSPEGRATLGDMQFLEPPEENPAYVFLSPASSTGHTMSTVSWSANNHLNNTSFPDLTPITEPLHKSTKNTFDWPGDAFFELNPSGSKTTTSEPLVLNSPFPNDQPEPPLSEQQIIFIKALTKTTATATDEFKITLAKLDYKKSYGSNPLFEMKMEVFDRLKKLTKAQKNQLETIHGIEESSIEQLIRSLQPEPQTSKKKTRRKCTSVLKFSHEDITFLKALIEVDSRKGSSPDKLKEVLQRLDYKEAITNSALITKKMKLFEKLKRIKDDGSAIHNLNEKGITQNHINKLLSQLSLEDITFLKVLIKVDSRKGSSLDEISKNLEGSETYTLSLTRNNIYEKKCRLLAKLENLSKYDIEYLATQDITQDQISELLSKFSPSDDVIEESDSASQFSLNDITFLKALIENDYQKGSSQKDLKKAIESSDYKGSTSNEALVIKRGRLFRRLKKLGANGSDIHFLNEKGITQDHINKLLCKFSVADLALLKALIEHDHRKGSSIDAVSKVLKDSSMYTASTVPQTLLLRISRFLPKLENLSKYDIGYLAAQGITQDQIKRLLALNKK